MTFDEIRAACPVYTLVDDDRQLTLHTLVKQVKHIPGPMIEVGAYKGGSAFMISRTNPSKVLHVCDTFEGLPDPDPTVDTHKAKEFSDTSYSAVAEMLKHPNVVVVHKGLFPQAECYRHLDHNQYSFVHIDVDLYKSTLDCLLHFYHKLTAGGIFISDDYLMPTCPGVKKAFDEFMVGKPEKLIDTGTHSCYFIKL